MKYPEKIRKRAISLRVDKRLSLKAISKKLGVSKSALSTWLKPYPLDSAEKLARMSRAGKLCGRARLTRGEEAPLHRLLKDREPAREEKAKIAEAAVLLRLLILGCNVYGSMFDGEKYDWVVHVRGLRNLQRMQVKSALIQSTGAPTVSLRCSYGRGRSRRYVSGEFDFIVGYDLFTDTAYVWTWAEVKDLSSSVTVCPEAAERWDKIVGRSKG